jgi:hypothetical protein
MTGDKLNARTHDAGGPNNGLESAVLSKLRGRLRDFSIEEVGEQLVLRGVASSYHVKQLAQHEVMTLTTRPILSNRITVRL